MRDFLLINYPTTTTTIDHASLHKLEQGEEKEGSEGGEGKGVA